MRRIAAMLLVSVFSFSPIGPALFVDADSNLPACCRRGGQHHCAMMDMDRDAAPSTGLAFSAHAAKCPFFPKGGAVLPHPAAALLAASYPACTALFSQLTDQAQAEAGYRISSSRSHQKRGPPSLLS
jgi:hypothetical protein